MELPNSVVALLIAAFAILPGVPGERLYTILVGWDWREDKWWRTLRWAQRRGQSTSSDVARAGLIALGGRECGVGQGG